MNEMPELRNDAAGFKVFVREVARWLRDQRLVP